ncbi:type III secretion system inner rod subunit SctI [Serratia silvae]|uniref:Type III secretion system inner rod subunit SctI n=1 Tax=Serratia silvae TaxID=2824122 RepID=A0ABT0K9Q4_9GAMM|nr:type III secretion system inner rod subunit SctI [Serratia silvae]MCL1028779.1 type III secretion system inner rod subunit SctI [Serratia silvae]
MDMSRSGATGALKEIADISMEDSNVQSLEELMIRAYAQTASGAQIEQKAVLSKLQQDSVTSDPAELFKLQQRTADYNLQVSLISTLTRKGVSAVETLLRS